MDDIAVKFVYGLVPMALIKFALPLSAWQDVIYRENDLLFVRCWGQGTRGKSCKLMAK